MQAARIPDNEAERLVALRRYDVLDSPAEPAFDALTKLASYLLKAPIALVSLVDRDRQWFKARYGLEAPEAPRDVSFCAHVVAQERLLVVEDARADERFADNPFVKGAPHIRFYAGQPLRTDDGFTLGTLCVVDQRPRKLSDQETEMLRLLAGQTMDQLERRRQNHLLAEREGHLRAILNAAVDGVVTFDENGTILAVNPAIEILSGYHGDELLGLNLWDLFFEPHRDFPVRSLDSFPDGHMGKFVRPHESVIVVRKDGNHVPVELSVGEMRVGKKLQFTGILRDVSERQAAMEELQRAMLTIEQNAANLQALLDVFHVGAVVLDVDERVEFINERAQTLLGLEPKLVTGRPCVEVMPGGAEYQKRLREAMAMPTGRRPRIPMLLESSIGQRHLELAVEDDPRHERRRLIFVYDVTELRDLRAATNRLSLGKMVGTGPAMAEVFRVIRDVAKGEWTVLIEGDTGTGKELAAHAIHAASSRCEGRFVAINCAGLTESLLSSQLFGHRRGSFTGAVADQEGVFEAAHGGTLFLDEIGEISPPIQAHLLRVLQEKEIVRVGETRPRKVDVRIIAATNRNLEEEVRAGRFRQDFFYRIRVARVALPALRERVEDIPILVEWFLAEARASSGKSVQALTPEAMDALLVYPWPGNIRELKSSVEYAMIHCRENVIGLGDLPAEVRMKPHSETHLPQTQSLALDCSLVSSQSLHEVLEADERIRIIDALRRAEGKRDEAARALGMSRATFYRRLKSLGLLRRTGSIQPN
jgi:PAS domain S-box-containing protein